MKQKRVRKQLTLYFSADQEHILDGLKKAAKTNFRTPEQEAVYRLSNISKFLDVKKDTQATADVVVTTSPFVCEEPIIDTKEDNNVIL